MLKHFYLFILLPFFIGCTTTKNGTSTSLKKKEIELEAAQQAINYAETITKEELDQHLYVIASDKYQGRETGKDGQKMTEKYLVDEFKQDGLAPGNNGKFIQEFDLIEKLAPTASFRFNEYEYFFCKDFYFFPAAANFESFDVPLTDIYDAGYGIVDGSLNDYAESDVKDKIVLIKVQNPGDLNAKFGVDVLKWTWKQKQALANQKGAKAVLFISDEVEAEIEKYKHYLLQATMELKDDNIETKVSNTIPFFFIPTSFYTTLLAEGNRTYNKEKSDRLLFNVSFTEKELVSSNVLAFVEGADDSLKNEIVVITAHYDHIGMDEQEVYNGADDDGSGTVALLEIAEAFQKAKNEGNGPKRSILIMPVSGEEKGLLGSSYYVSHPVYPLKNTVVDLNIDMIGRLDKKYENNPDYVYLIGSDRISKELHDISEEVNKTYSKLTLDYTYNKANDPNKYYYRSDHYNFAKNGIPVIFYFNGTHDDYHQPTDTYEKINFEKIEKITRLVFYTAWEIANRKERLTLD